MFKFRRWWLLCGAVLVGVVALNGVVNGVVDAKAAPAPRAVCVRGGATATDAVSGRGLVCVQTKVRGLRWRFQPTTVTTTTTTPTTTTVSGVVTPVLVSVSASDGVQITVAGMRPDTGVYSLQWVLQGSTFNTYQMARATSPSMSVPAGWFACNRTYTFRVFVMQADWQLADGHQTQNVTPHSTPFDVVMPACPAAAAPVAPLTCATGGACVVGDTGPGGGIVFYVQADGATFDCGATLASTCKYLEAAPADQSTGIVYATNAPHCYDFDSSVADRGCLDSTIYPGSMTAQGNARFASQAIGMGMANTNQIHSRLTAAGGVLTSLYAAGVAFAYTNNGKTDWYLPSKNELNQLFLKKETVGGFSDVEYWSSSEDMGTPPPDAWAQFFNTGDQRDLPRNGTFRVRPVRAFGGTVACADGGVCVVGDTGPGGGKVFYVQAGDPFTCGATLESTCKYLEAAPTSGTAAWSDAVYAWSGNTTELIGATAQGVAIGTGFKNTQAMVTQSNTAERAGTITRAYRGPNNLTDWYLPSKDELNQLHIRRTTAGLSTDNYWSSSENAAGTARNQFFLSGFQGITNKNGIVEVSDGVTLYVRPVRAFG